MIRFVSFVGWIAFKTGESKQYGFALVNLHKQISRAKKGWNKQTHTRTNAYTFSLEYLKQLRTFDVCLYLVFRLGVIRTLNSKTKFIWWKCTRSECQMKCGRDGAYYSRYLISIISKRLQKKNWSSTKDELNPQNEINTETNPPKSPRNRGRIHKVLWIPVQMFETNNLCCIVGVIFCRKIDHIRYKSSDVHCAIEFLYKLCIV